MKKILLGCIGAMSILGSGYAYGNEGVPLDTNDPTYMLHEGSFLSSSNIEAGDGGYAYSFNHAYQMLLLGQKFAFGINDRFSINANLRYQIGMTHHGHEDEHSLYIRGRGFSAELGGMYRLGTQHSNSINMTSDVLFGMRFAKDHSVWEYGPEFAKNAYYYGLRLGRQWTSFSLAGTIKSTYIFDPIHTTYSSRGNTFKHGLAYVDLTPEAYFRMVHDWRFGLGYTHRVATESWFDRDWVQLKLIKQYGRTQYAGSYSYEFKRHDSTVGFHLNLLF